MDKLRENLQKHKSIAWIVLLSYIIFNGTFVFPFSNELFPFDYKKGMMVIACYGIIGACFTGVLDKGKSFVVLVLTLLFTTVGLLCRYFLEYGEVSNSMNFMLVHIVSYLIIIPLYCMLVYWGIYKWCSK